MSEYHLQMQVDILYDSHGDLLDHPLFLLLWGLPQGFFIDIKGLRRRLRVVFTLFAKKLPISLSELSAISGLLGIPDYLVPSSEH